MGEVDSSLLTSISYRGGRAGDHAETESNSLNILYWVEGVTYHSTRSALTEWSSR